MTRLLRFGSGLFLTGIVCVAFACGDTASPGGRLEPFASQAPTAPQAAAARDVKVSAPFNVGDAIRQVHFAFRPEGGAWSAGHTTHAIRAGLEATTFTPYSGKTGGATVRLSPAAIGRTGSAAGAPGAAALDDKGSLLIARGDVTEKLQNEEEGLEQSWTFHHPLSGAGDLTVRIVVSGEAYVGETAKGLHFADAATGLGVRYGNATWVDANGQRTAVAAHFDSGAIVMRVPSDVVERSAYPAVLDPIVGPEFGMDNPVMTPAPLNQQNPSIVYNGSTYLVVWEDFRSGTGGSDIYATRVSPGGAVADVSGIAITQVTGAPGDSHPRAAWDGAANFFVVWADNRNAATTGLDIYGARVVAATGAVLDANGLPITSNAANEAQPAIAYSGTSFLVTYSLASGGPSGVDVYGQLVSTAGTLSGAPILLSRGGLGGGELGEQFASALAYDGTNYLVVWQDNPPGGPGQNPLIQGQFVTPAGAFPVGSAIFTASPNAAVAAAPTIAYDPVDQDYLVAWTDTRSGSRINAAAWTTAVSPATAVASATDIQLSSAAGAAEAAPVAAYDPNCAASVACFFVIYQDTRNGGDVFGTRVFGLNAGGSPPFSAIDPSGISFVNNNASAQGAPSVAADGTNYFGVWTDARNGPAELDIYGGRVARNGTPIDTNALLVSTSTNQQTSTSVAYDGTNYLVVWQDTRSVNVTSIFGTRVSFTPPDVGGVLDPSGITISSDATNKANPAVSFDGVNYVVVWEDARNGAANVDVFGARVAASTGTVLDPTGVPISTQPGNQQSPHVAYDGTNYFVVWQDGRNGAASVDIYGSRVSKAMGVLDGTGIPINTQAGNQTAPRIAFDGTNYLIVWNDGRANPAAIYGAQLVLASATVTPLAGVQISSAPSTQAGRPGISYDGTNFLVVWHDTRAGSNGFDIFGRLVNKASPPVPQGASDFVISNAANAQSAPVTAFDGTDHFVVWQDQRAGASDVDIYGARVTKLGAVVAADAAGIPIAATVNDPERRPAVAVDGLSPLLTGRGHILVVYDRFDASAQFGVVRARARFVEDLVLGTACNPVNNGGDCESGFCVDGVCCNTACGGGVATDCQACSVAAGAPANGTCAPVNSGQVCRVASAICDNPSTCDGVSLICPPDTFRPSTVVCRPAAGTCDVPENCTGLGPNCPADAFQASGFVCLAPLGACDNGATCTGSSAQCPADTFKPNTTVCHTAAGTCDTTVNCTGTTAACPASLLASGTVCKAANGACDNAETCTGSSPTCPADTPKASGTVCAAATECLQAATCNGTTDVCPAQTPVADGTPCQTGAGTCVAGVCVISDAGAGDGGATEGGAIDAGADSGTPDSGVVDSGAPDSGGARDSGGGSNDGSAAGDAADGGALIVDNSGGCGCRTVGSAGSVTPVSGAAGIVGLGLPLIVVWRRRRRR